MSPQELWLEMKEFEVNAKPGNFRNVFGWVGEHLWTKFTRVYQYNLWSLIETLDEANRMRLGSKLQDGTWRIEK